MQTRCDGVMLPEIPGKINPSYPRICLRQGAHGLPGTGATVVHQDDLKEFQPTVPARQRSGGEAPQGNLRICIPGATTDNSTELRFLGTSHTSHSFQKCITMQGFSINGVIERDYNNEPAQ